MNYRMLTVGLVVAVLTLSGSAGWVSAQPAPQSDVQAGIALYDSGKYAEAEAALRNCADPVAKAYLAASLAKQKKHAEAEVVAKEVLESRPTDEVAVAALGHALLGQDKNDEAIERLTAAIQAEPKLAYAYYWRGQAYNNKKKVSSMASDFQMFLKLAPKAPEVKLVQAVLAGLR